MRINVISPSLTERSLAPDLARGYMLLAISVANAPLFIRAAGTSPADRAAEFLHLTLLSNQARPLFVFLFGYGLAQWFTRETARGGDEARVIRALRVRGAVMMAIGLAHTVLLAPMDIVAVYGLAAVALVSMLRARDSTLLWTSALMLLPAITQVAMAFQLIATGQLDAPDVVPAANADFAALAGRRALEWPLETVVAACSVVPGVTLGMWAARHRILEQPGRHRRTLWRVCVVVLPISVLGALPAAIIMTGMWPRPPDWVVWTASFAQPLTGYAGGVAAAAAAGLLALRRPGAITEAVAAAGRRSLSIYLSMTVVFVVVFFPAGFGWADTAGHATAVAVAVAAWLGLVLLAALTPDSRWPAEALLRALTRRFHGELRTR